MANPYHDYLLNKYGDDASIDDASHEAHAQLTRTLETRRRPSVHVIIPEIGWKFTDDTYIGSGRFQRF